MMRQNDGMRDKEPWGPFMPIFLYLAVATLAAFVTPQEILSYSWASAFVASVGSVVPAIEVIPPSYPLHGVFKFCLALMWVLLPVATVAMYYSVENFYRTEARRHELVEGLIRGKWFLLTSFATFIPIILLLLSVDLDGSTLRQRGKLNSRAGIAYHSLLFVCVQYFFALTYAWIVRVPQIYFGKK